MNIFAENIINAFTVMGSILKHMYFKEYFKYMLSILQCILNRYVVFVI